MNGPPISGIRGSGIAGLGFWVDLSQFTPRIAIIYAKVRDGHKNAAESAAKVMAEEIKSLAPVRTGAYRDSVEVKQVSDTQYLAGPTVDYAKYVEYGRGEVRPVRAKALRFADGRFSQYAGPAPGQFVVQRAYRQAHGAAVNAAKASFSRGRFLGA